MKKQVLILIISVIAIKLTMAQELTQTIRGKVTDTDSQLPLIGVTIIIAETDPVIGTTTGLDGNYRIDNVPVGRVTLNVSYLGYENKLIPNIVVNSGKEVVLDIHLQESVLKMDEVVVKATKNNGDAVNEMSLISAHSMSVEQTQRFTGSFNDPSKILSNFAGVRSTPDGSNDIIVRGNSPKYIQWRLEGVEITNPNHFEDQNSASGGICALNNNLLATSDFYTGAFSPEYGDALSGIYDVKLRNGNNEKFESTFGISLMGTDLTAEGPFKKGYSGSYLINYRYSTVSLLNDFGLTDLDGDLKFQDMAFKVYLPAQKFGTFSIFGLGGLNSCYLEDLDGSFGSTPGDRSMREDVVEDYDKSNHLLNTGLNHILSISKNSYIKTSLSYSSTGLNDDYYQSSIIEINGEDGILIPDTVGRVLNYASKLRKEAYRGAITYNNKINAKNKLQVGAKYSLFRYNNAQSMLSDDLITRNTLVDFNGNVSHLRNFVSWKHRFNEKITVVAGVHNMNVLLNNKNTIEPRIAFTWQLNHSSSLNIGYGNHSNMERIHNYFTKIQLEDGSTVEPNKDLDLLKAHYYVLGYKKHFNENLSANIEVYYQDLYNLPVENNDTSFYATINEGLEYRYVDLVNKGTGRNYGIEFTLERNYNNNFYYLINASVYDSKYTALDGVERDTRYNSNYLVNILCGKEFDKLGKKNNKSLSINAKASYSGGMKIIPLLRDNNGDLAVDPENNKFWDYEKAYENKIEDIYVINLSVSYKINRPKVTHEIFLDLNNVTGAEGRISEYYDKDEPGSVGYMKQFAFYPNLMYKIYF